MAGTLGELEPAQARRILAARRIGLLTCDIGGRPSVLAVHYHVRDATHIDVETNDAACHALASRGVPVRLEVDDVQDSLHWSTVIAWGLFEPQSQGPETSTCGIRLTGLRGFSQNPTGRTSSAEDPTAATPGRRRDTRRTT